MQIYHSDLRISLVNHFKLRFKCHSRVGVVKFILLFLFKIKMRLALYILLLFLVVQDIFASDCKETFEVRQRRDDYYWNYEDEYDDSYLRSSTPSPTSSSLACINVSSLKDLPVPLMYTEIPRNYDHSMNVSHSNVPTIPTGVFSQFPFISKLHLSGIHIRNIEPGAFTNLTRLRELYLDHNELSELKSSTFTCLNSLNILDLSDNIIRSIDVEAFQGLDNLTKLDLKYNSISKLADGVFENLTRLESLDLSGNALGKFPWQALTTSKDWPLNLTALRMSETSIDQFDIDLSKASLEHLNMSSNQIKTFDFSLLPQSIALIDLSRNVITSWNNLNMLRVRRIYLDYNYIQSINGPLSDVSELHLSHNMIKELQATLFNKSLILREIDLSYNYISIIDKDLFLGLENLAQLNLAFNNISAIAVGTFRSLNSLLSMNLSYNNIQKFQHGTFEKLSNLGILDISGNKLKELDVAVLFPLRFLYHLYLANNEITSLDYENLIARLNSLKTVSLHNNGQWKCKDLVEVEHAFQGRGVILKPGSSFEVENFHGISCENPNEVEITSTQAPAFSSEEFYRHFQKVVNKGVHDSKINAYLNDGFKNSTLYRFFNEERAFPKVSKSEDESDGDTHLIVANTFQIILSVLLLVVVCLVFMAFRKYRAQFSSNARLYYKP